jgi:hypothetical protein
MPVEAPPKRKRGIEEPDRYPAEPKREREAADRSAPTTETAQESATAHEVNLILKA